MKPVYICFFVLFSLLLLSDTNLSYSSTSRSFKAKVVKIIDGDSLKVKEGKKKHEIRLYGIDAPEYDQAYAGKAKKYVKKIILGRGVKVTPIEYDRYGRLVAIVQVGDTSINEKLLSQGLAWYYPKYCKKKICSSWKKVSKAAKKQKKNIWSSSSSVAPWTWKYNKHK